MEVSQVLTGMDRQIDIQMPQNGLHFWAKNGSEQALKVNIWATQMYHFLVIS